MIDAWKKFFGTGWLHGQEPSKQDCFKAGYEAAVKEQDYRLKQLSGFTPETVFGMLKEWQEKYHE